MKTPIKHVLFALAAVAGGSSLQADIVYQGLTDDFVKFQAGSYDSLINTGTSVITDNGDGTLTTTARNDSAAATLTYTIDFLTTGNYTLYFELTAPGASLSQDSMFTATSLGVTPLATSAYNWNNLRQVDTLTGHGWAALSLTAGDDVAQVGGSGTEYTSGPAPFEVSGEGMASLIFRPRENGLIWENFVLSTNGALTATELDGLSYSSLTPIPEPSTYAAIAGVFVLGVAYLRRRRSSSC